MENEMDVIAAHGEDILQSENMILTRTFLQHGETSVYDHSVMVAARSIRIMRALGWALDERAIVRGALLHDYYLYDWHIRAGRKGLHGFRHPGIAFRNASCDFSLGRTERDIILHHMFPLTPIPPLTWEGLIVCICDKCCALYETFPAFFAGISANIQRP